jgi:predicted DNA-binding protein
MIRIETDLDRKERAMSRRDRDEALRALAEPLDFTDAVLDTVPSRVKVVHSVRLDPDLSERLEAEASRRGITPSALLRDLVENGLAPGTDDTVITVRVSELHRAIDTALRRAA